MGKKSFEWKYTRKLESKLDRYELFRDGVSTGWIVLDTSQYLDNAKYALVFVTCDERGVEKTVEWKQFWNSLEDAKRRAESAL